MPIFNGVLGRDPDDAERAIPGVAAGRAVRGGMSALAGLIRRHRLFSIALGLSVVPRIIVMLGFQPAILFKLDSYDYLWDAAHLTPNPVNSSGYALYLWALRPFHSLALVAGLQHLLGLVTAVLVYATLRRWGVRQWLATLAAMPVLFAPAEFLLEHLIMADLLALALLVAGFAVLLLRQSPSVARTAAAGLLVGASALVRPTTLPLIAVMALYLLVRRAGWRRVGAVLAGGALPVVAYMSWFSAANGSFNLTNSNGLFLWSRTMSFANCAIIKPPADLRALCPERQPITLARPGAKRLAPKRYLWDHRAWQWQPPPTGLVPDASAFTAANNSRALRFAVRAIEAQPSAYAHVVGSDAVKLFIKQIGFVFPPLSLGHAGLTGQNQRYALAAVTAYLGSAQGLAPYLGSHFGQRVVEPFGHLIRGYQRVIFLPGPVFAVVMAIGLAGLLLPGRRSAAAAMLWLSAMLLLLLPIAEHEYNYRYALPAIPLGCMAAALAFRSRTPAQAAVAAAPVTGPADRATLADVGTRRADQAAARPPETPADGAPDMNTGADLAMAGSDGHPEPRSVTEPPE